MKRYPIRPPSAPPPPPIRIEYAGPATNRLRPTAPPKRWMFSVAMTLFALLGPFAMIISNVAQSFFPSFASVVYEKRTFVASMILLWAGGVTLSIIYLLRLWQDKETTFNQRQLRLNLLIIAAVLSPYVHIGLIAAVYYASFFYRGSPW